MPSTTTLELIADILVKRIVEEFVDDGKLTLETALERAFPFEGVPEGEAIWRKAAERAQTNGRFPSSGFQTRKRKP